MIVIKTKSVSEVAKELNISRQAVHQKIKQLPSNLTPNKVNGAYQLTPAIVDFIRNNTSSTINDNQFGNQTIDKQVDGLKEVLKEIKRENEKLYQQLETKDKQLAERDELLKELKRLIDQQQQLTLQANNRNEKLEIELESLKDEKEKEVIIESKTQATKKWWQFFK
ncbi:MAG TPA: hypothetical protein DEA45_01360 [Acholeplasmataceae bacterium]|nr:hypothetical protein [Acholeplasmataceae bacterium]